MTTRKTIKVQVIGGVTTKSAIESGLEMVNEPLTFHAYTDAMKARVLESFMGSGGTIGLSFTDETPRDGEWHEEMVLDAVFCPAVDYCGPGF
jgi:hypothetical protein